MLPVAVEEGGEGLVRVPGGEYDGLGGVVADTPAGRFAGAIAAISVGIVDGTPMLDLPYVEDVAADTDMNVVATGDGELIEVQGTAEGAPFTRTELDVLLELALEGCRSLSELQRSALAQPLRSKHTGDRASL